MATMNGLKFVYAPKCECCHSSLIESGVLVPARDLRLGFCARCQILYVVEPTFTGDDFAGWEIVTFPEFMLALQMNLIPVTSLL